jgi:hypothetical protein
MLAGHRNAALCSKGGHNQRCSNLYCLRDSEGLDHGTQYIFKDSVMIIAVRGIGV